MEEDNSDVRIPMNVRGVKKRVQVHIDPNPEQIGRHRNHYDYYDDYGYNDRHSHEKENYRETQYPDGKKEIDHTKTKVKHSDGNGWWGCGGGSGCGIWGWLIGIFFLFFLVLIIGSFFNHGHHDDFNHHGGGGFHPHAKRDIIRRKDQCSVGETFASKFNQCLPRLMHPVGIDHTIQDKSVKACDDFEKFASGKWDTDPNQSGESTSFTYIERKNQYQVQKIIQDPT